MNRRYPECHDSEPADWSVAADVCFRQEPDEEEEEDDGKQDHDDDNEEEEEDDGGYSERSDCRSGLVTPFSSSMRLATLERKAGGYFGDGQQRKINGKWLIVHDHISVPIDFDSGKAALDLKP